MNIFSHRFFNTVILTVAVALTSGAQEIVHPRLGTSTQSPGGLRLTLTHRLQNWNYAEKSTLNKNIISPKSVNIHPDGGKLYINSLEGALTVVVDAATYEELTVIRHRFSAADSMLWAPASGYYPFTHYTKDLNTFTGKPVESVFSHNGRFLWIPYYRRSYDINAQDPSAVAVIDTRTDKIVRIFEAGVLPKMIAVNPSSTRIAIAHWGDNTVGYLNCEGTDPSRWHHLKPFVVDHQIKWDLSLTKPVNRDEGSGNALRGTAFTPDGQYLLVACMGGTGGIAVIDTRSESGAYLGKLYGMMPNVRHIIFSNANLYMSVNKSGYVQRISLTELNKAIEVLATGEKRRHTIAAACFDNAKVGAGARTIVSSPKGRFIFVACNYNNSVDVVDTKSMKRVVSLPADSYPVGMDISSDGTKLYVTSQGRKNKVPSGNCVDIIGIDY